MAPSSNNIQSVTEQGLWALFAALPMLSSNIASTSLLLPDQRIGSYFSLLLLTGFITFTVIATALIRWAAPGGPAWGASLKSHAASIKGPRGWPVIGSLLSLGPLAHRTLAELSQRYDARSLIALSLGNTRLIVASTPASAKDILTSSSFADRPLKESARQLLFDRAIGFAPYGDYWRKLRRIAATHLFAPRRIAEHEGNRQFEADAMIDAIAESLESVSTGEKKNVVCPRRFLQQAALNNVMVTVFGRRYDFSDESCAEAKELQAMVREGFELLGAFNMADHLPALQALDAHCIRQRCEALVPRVNAFVSKIIGEHREQLDGGEHRCADFVYVLLGMQEEEGLSDADIIAILWEMIFRGTDSVAILLEWVLAELVLNPDVQERLTAELQCVVGAGNVVRDAHVPHLPYLQAVVYETLRLHPPGPLLSWARLAIHDVEIAGHQVPAGTTAMVNMWAISHDPEVWVEPLAFKPHRFLDSAATSGLNFDIRGADLRLAPFGAGRRVCPGRALGLTTVNLWLARLVQRFEFRRHADHAVDLTEHLKLSCEMKTPLVACCVDRALSH